MTKSTRLRRITAAIAAGVLLASMVLVGWHRATVVHGRCLEHGDEIDLERIASGNAKHSDGVAVTPASFAQGAGDGHCEILAASHASSTVAPVFAHHAAIVIVTQAQPPALAPSSSCELYRLAPKTSPPRA